MRAIAMKLRNILVRSKRAIAGETLAEVLVAVLVVTFAAIMLATSVGVAAHLNNRAQANEKALSADQLYAESYGGGTASPEEVIAEIVADDGTVLGVYKVGIFRGDNNKYRSYAKAGE